MLGVNVWLHNIALKYSIYACHLVLINGLFTPEETKMSALRRGIGNDDI